MKNKKIFTRMLMVCLLLSTMCVPVLGAQEDSKGLEQAIVSAKKNITVPESFTDFTNHSSERETIDGKVRVWNLNWSEKEGKISHISASVGEDGFLYEYNKYNSDKVSSGLAQVTKDKAKASADEFLKQVIPEYADQMKIVENNYNSYSNEEYNFTYQKFVNEIPVSFIKVNIGVNKYSGEVTSFNRDNPESKGLEYPSLDAVLEPALAEKAYIEKLGVDLKYRSYYDNKQKKMNVFAGYSLSGGRKNAIDAKTGQVVSIADEYDGYNDKTGSMGLNNLKTTSDSAKQELTKEETDAVNNIANIITKEKAESIIREASDIITSDMKVSGTDLNKNYNNENYVWNISFEGGYGEVDAQSGEVLSLNSYKDNKEAINKNISKAEAQNIAEDFLKKITPNKFTQTKYQEDKDRNLKINDLEEEKTYNFSYIRQVNGMEFSNNRLSVEVNMTNGKVSGYDNNWYENVSFPETSNAMTKADAFNKIKGLSGFELQYILLDSKKVGLVYNFKEANNKYIIDPINGVRLDYTGQPYKDNKLPEYNDISGHWCEKTVKELLDNGYYIDGEKFNPDMNITQIKFFKYIYSQMKNNYTDDKFYDMLVKNGVIKIEEKAPDALVSNQDAAKYIVRYLGYDKVAIHPEVFVNPFKDTVEEQYKGYAAISYGLNIIKGDTNGNFNGSNNITNAEAATMLYNLISIGHKDSFIR